MTIVLSVIIPIYNVEATLRRCLDSVLAQEVEDLEVVLVDDGSTDGSSDIAMGYALQYSCFKLVRQANGGLSCARNTGIDEAQGKYVTFLDSDDYLHPETLVGLVKIIKSHPELDILEYSVISDVPNRGCQLADQVYTDVRDYWLRANAFGHTYACNKIFRKALLDAPSGNTDAPGYDGEGKLRFPLGRVFEDMYFYPSVLMRNPVVMTTSQGYYHYAWNPQGITAQADGKKLCQLLESQLRAAEMLQMAFMQPDCKHVPEEENAFYCAILNNQISVCRLTPAKPLLPSRKLRLGSVDGVMMKMKALILNLFGVEALCKVMALVK